MYGLSAVAAAVLRSSSSRRREWQGGIPRQILDHESAVVVAGVEAGADRRRADVQLAQLLRRLRHIVRAPTDARGVAAEFLAERDRYRILQMRAAGLEHAR